MHRPGEFEPDERLDTIAFGEAVEAAALMLDDALDQVRGDAGVECAMPRAGHDSGAGLEVGVYGVEARAAMDPGSSPGDEVCTKPDTSPRLVMPDLIPHPRLS